jgi:hypothetical protein
LPVRPFLFTDTKWLSFKCWCSWRNKKKLAKNNYRICGTSTRNR